MIKLEEKRIDVLLNGKHAKSRWNPALSNAQGGSAQINDASVEAINTITFMPFQEVPKYGKVTYTSFICEHRPLKDKEQRIRLVVGRDKLTYEFDSSPPATNLTEIKLMINSAISDTKHGAKFVTVDLKDTFLHTTMEKPEDMEVCYK